MTQTLRRPDAELTRAVVRELGRIATMDGTHIGVAVDVGAGTLSGEVVSCPEKLLAGTAAQRRSAPGLTGVTNQRCIDH